MTVPPSTNDTNFVPDHEMYRRLLVVPEVCDVQLVPFCEVRMVPLFPTVARIDPDQATPLRLLDVPDVCGDQLVPFCEVKMVPLSPTTTN